MCTRASRALMAGAPLEERGKAGGRVSGDSTVAYAMAFAQAMEAALGLKPPRACCLAARIDGRAGADRQSFRRHRRGVQ